ncbi:MAG: hypothetical protein DMG97_24685 [Acidobacteria bacterium]|nr:MAG: hypothetical protein DMG97_24685 [Acidobacteriota bacterium]
MKCLPPQETVVVAADSRTGALEEHRGVARVEIEHPRKRKKLGQALLRTARSLPTLKPSTLDYNVLRRVSLALTEA